MAAQMDPKTTLDHALGRARRDHGHGRRTRRSRRRAGRRPGHADRVASAPAALRSPGVGAARLRGGRARGPGGDTALTRRKSVGPVPGGASAGRAGALLAPRTAPRRRVEARGAYRDRALRRAQSLRRRLERRPRASFWRPCRARAASCFRLEREGAHTPRCPCRRARRRPNALPARLARVARASFAPFRWNVRFARARSLRARRSAARAAPPCSRTSAR